MGETGLGVRADLLQRMRIGEWLYGEGDPFGNRGEFLTRAGIPKSYQGLKWWILRAGKNHYYVVKLEVIDGRIGIDIRRAYVLKPKGDREQERFAPSRGIWLGGAFVGGIFEKVADLAQGIEIVEVAPRAPGRSRVSDPEAEGLLQPRGGEGS